MVIILLLGATLAVFVANALRYRSPQERFADAIRDLNKETRRIKHGQQPNHAKIVQLMTLAMELGASYADRILIYRLLAVYDSVPEVATFFHDKMLHLGKTLYADRFSYKEHQMLLQHVPLDAEQLWTVVDFLLANAQYLRDFSFIEECIAKRGIADQELAVRISIGREKFASMIRQPQSDDIETM